MLVLQFSVLYCAFWTQSRVNIYNKDSAFRYSSIYMQDIRNLWILLWLRYLTKLGSRQPPISKTDFLACSVLCRYKDVEENYATKKNSFCPKDLCPSFRSLLCKISLNPLVQLLISKFINIQNQMIRLVGSKRTWRYYGTIMAYQVSTHSWCKGRATGQ